MTTFVRGYVPEDVNELKRYLEEMGRRLEEAFETLEVGASLEVEDSGLSIDTAVTTLNFLGDLSAVQNGAGVVDVSVAGGGGGGTGWEKIEEVTITATSAIDITFDESLYHAIRVEANAMTLANDSKRVELYLGSDNGATIHNTTGDYVMFYTNLIAANVWATNNTSTHVLMMTSSVGNAAGEEVSFTIELTHFGGVNQGAFIETNANWIATNGSQIAQKTFASMFGQEAIVDTIRIQAETGAFGTGGTLSVYGLLK